MPALLSTARSRLVPIVLLSTVVAGVARGASPSARPLTWGDALTVAEADAPAVVTTVAQADVVAADVRVAGRLPDPQIALGTTTASFQLLTYLYVNLPVFGQVGTAVGAAKAQAAVAEAGVEVARLDARLAAEVAWVDLWEAQAIEVQVRDDAARRDRVLAATRERFEVGEVPKLDVLRAEVDAERARAEVRASDEQRLAASARLQGWLGGSATETLEAVGAPPTPPPALPDPESLTAADHPLLRRAASMIAAAEAARRRDDRSLAPMVNAQIQGRELPRNPTGTADVWMTFGFNVPLFDQPVVRRANVAVASARTGAEAVDVEVRARLAAAGADLEAAEARLRTLVDEVVPRAQLAADLSDEAYRSGGLDLTGVLAAEQALSDAKQARIRAEAVRGRAWARVLHASGRRS